MFIYFIRDEYMPVATVGGRIVAISEDDSAISARSRIKRLYIDDLDVMGMITTSPDRMSKAHGFTASTFIDNRNPEKISMFSEEENILFYTTTKMLGCIMGALEW